jgi:hypothetical protein
MEGGVRLKLTHQLSKRDKAKKIDDISSIKVKRGCSLTILK